MNTDDLPAVGFIGLGDQGLPMAIAIAEAGYSLQAWARRPASLDGLIGVAHARHEDIADFAAASEIVCLCVSTDEDVRALLTGGLLKALRPGGVVVNHGTGIPSAAVEMARTCAAAGVEFLDAPVSGGRLGAEARTLTSLVGGPEYVVRRCEALFRSFSEHVVHVGDHGSGQITKLLNNTLLMMNQANIAEIVDLAARSGVDTIRLVQALKLGSGSSRALELLPVRSTVSLEATAAHLTEVELLDMSLFDTAMTELKVEAHAVSARGVAGAHSLLDVVKRLNP